MGIDYLGLFFKVYNKSDDINTKRELNSALGGINRRVTEGFSSHVRGIKQVPLDMKGKQKEKINEYIGQYLKKQGYINEKNEILIGK